MPDTSTRPPSIETLLSHADLADLIDQLGRPVVTDLVRAEIDSLRKRIQQGDPWPNSEALAAGVTNRAAVMRRTYPLRVINATGVLIHTNLGRAPYGAHLLKEMTDRLEGYLALEYDLNSGSRGKRSIAVERDLAALAETEAALVVNNNAAAVYLALSALAWNREVVISRGELVQIGGGFRIPDILAKSGAVLREVGTTNQTNAKDYEQACNPNTALIMKVHRSNFTQTGFVSEVDAKELADIGKRVDVPILWDVGSGAVGPGATCQYTGEPTLCEAMATGVDLVTCSGDKLLGGPQAGIVLGRKDLIQKLRDDPFYRAMRPDKATLVALELTVAAHRAGRANELLPLYQMASVDMQDLKSRTDDLARIAKAAGWHVSMVETADTFGGGSAPGQTMRGWGLRITGPLSATEMAERARAFDTPIIGTISDDAFVLALRMVSDHDQDDLARFLRII